MIGMNVHLSFMLYGFDNYLNSKINQGYCGPYIPLLH